MACFCFSVLAFETGNRASQAVDHRDCGRALAGVLVGGNRFGLVVAPGGGAIGGSTAGCCSVGDSTVVHVSGFVDKIEGLAARDNETTLYALYCRLAGIVFFLVVVYTLVLKLPTGLAGDRVHTLLHVITGSVALYLGWSQGRRLAKSLFTITVAIAYGVLGMSGWFVDGIALDSNYAVPLGPADNVFHLLLALTAAWVVVASKRRDLLKRHR